MGSVSDDGRIEVQDDAGAEWAAIPAFLGGMMVGAILIGAVAVYGTGPGPSIPAAPATPFVNLYLEASCPEHVIGIDQAIKHGRAMSERLGCTIKLRYRGKHLLIYRGRTDGQIVEDYLRAVAEAGATTPPATAFVAVPASSGTATPVYGKP